MRTVLTPDAKNGIFTYRDTAGAVQKVNLASLRTFTKDPTVKAMIAQLPTGNSTDAGDGLNTTGYLFNARDNEFRDQFVYRGDYYLSSRHNITGTYNYIRTRRTGRIWAPSIPPFRQSSNSIKNHVLSLAWRWTPCRTSRTRSAAGLRARWGTSMSATSTPSRSWPGLSSAIQ